MKFISTRDKNHLVSARDAVLKGLPPDGGLYVPVSIPRFTEGELQELSTLALHEIGSRIALKFFDEDLPRNTIETICKEAFFFEAPLKKLDDSHFILELFYGPSLAFKDFAAAFMARLMASFVKDEDREFTILVATSGDTGSAVAHGFFNLPGIKVYVLYPSGKVSALQESQMATLGGNITSCEVSGSFDDCQKLVKQAFLDPDIGTKLKLTSANSINIARLIPQTVYYFSSYFGVRDLKRQVVFSVPSGNFGNLTAGLLAKHMGLPVRRFMAATNANDLFPVYLRSGKLTPRTPIATISNAMDVGDPSNFVRIQYLYNNQLGPMRADLIGQGFSDQETLNMIERVYRKFSYLLDPHGAVGFLGLGQLLREHPGALGISLETAHPAKFLEVYPEALRSKIQIPITLAEFAKRKKLSVPLQASLSDLKKLLLS